MKVILTKHAEQRALERNISKDEIFDGLVNPYNLEKRNEKNYCQKYTSRGVIEIVFERKDNNLIVITVYWV
ncbi:MAG: DUF4258 domain-containing protein [archaeon]|jgi:hypothetical protein